MEAWLGFAQIALQILLQIRKVKAASDVAAL
jgi:hypothetical protein